MKQRARIVAGGLVDPGPGVGGLRALRRASQRAHLGRRAELDVVELGRPLRPRGDVDQLALTAHTDLAGPRLQRRHRAARPRQQPGGADRRVAGERKLEARGEDPDPAAAGIVDVDRLAEAQLGGDPLALGLGHRPPSRKTPSGLPHSPSSLTKTRRTWSSGTLRSYAGLRRSRLPVRLSNEGDERVRRRAEADIREARQKRSSSCSRSGSAGSPGPVAATTATATTPARSSSRASTRASTKPRTRSKRVSPKLRKASTTPTARPRRARRGPG